LEQQKINQIVNTKITHSKKSAYSEHMKIQKYSYINFKYTKIIKIKKKIIYVLLIQKSWKIKKIKYINENKMENFYIYIFIYINSTRTKNGKFFFKINNYRSIK